MRDPEEKPRSVGMRNKSREESYDEPTVRRRRSMSGNSEFAEDGDANSARAGFFARYGGNNRADDEETAYPKQRQRRRDRDEYDEEDEGESAGRAPFLVRMFAWIALLAIFFVCGYLGANYFFNWADKKGDSRIGNVIGSGSEVNKNQETAPASNVSAGDAKYTLYIPEDGKFTKREIDIKKGLPEEDIEKVISMYVDGLKELNILEPGVRTLNIFRSGDWLYLDMTAEFQSSLKTLGKDKATLAVTGLVRTMRENFPPISKIKFYIGGKESKDSAPIDLTKPWEMS